MSAWTRPGRCGGTDREQRSFVLLDTGFQINQPVTFPEPQRGWWYCGLVQLPFAPQWELPYSLGSRVRPCPHRRRTRHALAHTGTVIGRGGASRRKIYSVLFSLEPSSCDSNTGGAPCGVIYRSVLACGVSGGRIWLGCGLLVGRHTVDVDNALDVAHRVEQAAQVLGVGHLKTVADHRRF